MKLPSTIKRALAFALTLSHLTACSGERSGLRENPIQTGTAADPHLREISGMTVSRRRPDVLWVHNDGSQGRLFALTTTGRVAAVFALPGDSKDLEDIASGPGPDPASAYLYLGDIGDNDEERGFVRLHRLLEPDLRPELTWNNPGVPTDVQTFDLRYPDEPHDAETLLVDPLTAEILVVTKEKQRARVYAIASTRLQENHAQTLDFVGEVPFAKVSAGEVSPDGTKILLRREDAARLWTRQPGESIGAAFARPPTDAAVVGPPAEPNGEAVAWDFEGRGYYTVSEGRNQPIYYFRHRP